MKKNWIELQKVCSVNMGQSPESTSYNQEQEGVPFFQGNADFGELYPEVRTWCNKPTKLASNGDLLISVRAPIGALNFANQECCIGRGLAAISSLDQNINMKYIYYALKSKTKELNYLGTGSTFKAINKKTLSETNIPNIDRAKQDACVSLLDQITDIIGKRKEQMVLLDNLIKSRFVEMFGDMILNPNRWEKVLLGEVCDVRDGTHDSPKYFTEGYPLVTSKNVTGGKIDFIDCNLICEEDYKKINQRSKVDYGDILMPMIGTVGKPVIVDIDEEFAIKNVALIKFKEDAKVKNSFVKALLESDFFDRAVISKIRGGTQKFISLGDIRKLEICLPPMEIQNQFATFVRQIDKLKFTSTFINTILTISKIILR